MCDEQWLKGQLCGPAFLLLAHHDRFVVKGTHVYRLPEFEQPAALAAWDLETQVLSEQGLSHLRSEVHDPPLFERFAAHHEFGTSKGFALGFSKEALASEPSQLRHIDRIHASSSLLR